MMVFQKLLAVRKADAQLPGEVRSALVDSLYAPFASLVVGALSGGIIGAMVSIRANDIWLTLCCFAIFISGILRIISAMFYRRRVDRDSLASALRWERIYEYGAWSYSG